MTESPVIIDPKQYGLEENKANELTTGLPQILSERKVLEEQYSELIALDIELPETAKKAAELRKLIKNNRTKGIEAWHKGAKDYFLKGGQFVDAIKRKELAINERMEETLEQIEKHAENKERERKAAIKAEREAELSKYCENVSLFPLGEMTQEAYEQLLNGQILAHEAKVEAERKAEDARIEQERKEAEEREAQRIENEKLIAEVMARERQLEAEREAARKQQAELEEKARKEREESEKALAEERRIAAEHAAKLKAEQDAKLDAERKERERVQKELDDKKAAEAKAEADRIAAIEAEAQKGDSAKIEDLKKDLELLKTKYTFKSAKSKKTYSEVQMLLDKVINHIIGKQ